MTIVYRTWCLTVSGFLICSLASSSAFAQLKPTRVNTTIERGTVVAANADQGLLTVRTTAGRLIQFRAFGSAGPGDRATIPATVTTVNTPTLPLLEAQKYCTDLQGWLNTPPPDLGLPFPYSFPDMGPEWQCNPTAVINKATSRPDWNLGFSCKCEAVFPVF